jgi:hypothetical protein
MNLLKLLWWKKPKPEQSDITHSERADYDDYIETLHWNIKCLKGEADAQVIDNAKLRGQILRISLEADAQAAENNNLREQIAKKSPAKRKKK